MKKIILILCCLILVSIVMAESHLLVADEDGQSSDVLVLADIGSLLAVEGETTESVLNKEIGIADLEDRISIFVYYGNALIIAPEGYEELVAKIVANLKNDHGITAELIEPMDISSNDLTKEIHCEDCPRKPDTISSALEIVTEDDPKDLLVICPEADKDACLNLLDTDDMDHGFIKRPDEVTANDLFDHNVLIVGGPCANSFWGGYSNETCETWPHGDKKGILKVFNSDDGFALLLAGTTKDDTFDISFKLRIGDIDLDSKETIEIDLN